MQRERIRVKSWSGICAGIAAGLFLLTAVGAGHAAAGPQGQGKDQKKPEVSQQLCAPNSGTCAVNTPCCSGPVQEQTKSKTPDKPVPAPKK
jgi:hypothetical protein